MSIMQVISNKTATKLDIKRKCSKNQDNNDMFVLKNVKDSRVSVTKFTVV
jgi:hypothetical protein